MDDSGEAAQKCPPSRGCSREMGFCYCKIILFAHGKQENLNVIDYFLRGVIPYFHQLNIHTRHYPVVKISLNVYYMPFSNLLNFF